jgi:hypothetical protein
VRRHFPKWRIESDLKRNLSEIARHQDAMARL